ncbi:hypothetical protein Tco_0546417 [Tanacetum coccineum]
MCEHVSPKATTSHGSNTSQQRMLKRFTMADDLKECSKITQVKGTKPKSTTLCTKGDLPKGEIIRIQKLGGNYQEWLDS